MRRWIALAARLYPRRWRERYGVEFDALMSDVDADWRELANVMGGAMKMQLKSNLGLMLTLATACAFLVFGVAWCVPQRYVSTARLRVTPADDLDIRRALFWQPKERANIRLTPLAAGEFEIAYSHEDSAKARAFTQQLVSRALAQHAATERRRQSAWIGMSWGGAPPVSKMELMAPPSESRRAAVNWLAFGLGGVLTGIILAASIRRPRTALRLAIPAAAGCILALAAWSLMPHYYTSVAELRLVAPLNPAPWYDAVPHEPLSGHLPVYGRFRQSNWRRFWLVQIFALSRPRSRRSASSVLRGRARGRTMRWWRLCGQSCRQTLGRLVCWGEGRAVRLSTCMHTKSARR